MLINSKMYPEPHQAYGSGILYRLPKCEVNLLNRVDTSDPDIRHNALLDLEYRIAFLAAVLESSELRSLTTVKHGVIQNPEFVMVDAGDCISTLCLHTKDVTHEPPVLIENDRVMRIFRRYL